MKVFKFKLLNFLFSQKLIDSRPCRDLNLGSPRLKAAVLTIELWRLDTKSLCTFTLKLKLFSFQNFSVCKKCSRLGQLFHRLTHQKHRMFNMCSEVVEGRKKSSPAYDTTKILNELLANDAWLEQVNKTKLTTTNDIIAGNVWEVVSK